jgi:voltage-gated potassium channel Kch
LITPVVLLVGTDRLAAAIKGELQARNVEVRDVKSPARGELTVTSDELGAAQAMLLVEDDDAANVDNALSTRRLAPHLPLVVRLFDPALAAYLQETVDAVTILSVSSVTAPAFIEAAEATLKGTAEGGAVRAGLKAILSLRETRRRWRPDRVMVGAFVTLVLFVGGAASFFSASLNLSLLDSIYFVWTTITTVGYGDIALRDASSTAKVIGMFVMFGGAAFMALLFSVFADWVLARRLEVLSGRVRVRGRGHVVIVGGGNIGFRVADGLAAGGYRTVVLEKNAEGRHLTALRAKGHAVIVADATREETLALAGVSRAAAILALTESESTNLYVVLAIRAQSKRVPIVMRTSSVELSNHVTEHGEAIAIAPFAVAARAFAAAALDSATRFGGGRA